MRFNVSSVPFISTIFKSRQEILTGKDFFEENRVKEMLLLQNFNKLVKEKLGEKALDYISDFIKIDNSTQFSYTNTDIYIPENQQVSSITIIKHIELNSINNLNSCFRLINKQLRPNGRFISYINTPVEQTAKSPTSGSFQQFVAEKIYKIKNFFGITGNETKFISKAELLGRLCYSGFSIESEQQIDNRLYVVAKKIKPANKTDKKYGMLISLNRIGLKGKAIKVFKFRSMYPYSEYLQEYIYMKNNLQEGGKFKDDFRISPLGNFIRKCWIDELPMLINLLKGDIKLFGVRPLSAQYFGLYPKELQDLRTKSKPGLIPPFYVDMPKTLEDIIESELDYLKKYEKAPLKTDFSYFFKAFYNILFGGKRSN